MKLHLSWIRVTAAAAMIASVQPAAAQYVPYQPQGAATLAPQQPAVPQAPLPQQPVYSAYRPQYQAQAPTYTPTPTPAYPTTSVAQYPQATTTYPQYPQTAVQENSQAGAYSYLAKQPTPSQSNQPLPAPRQMNTSVARPSEAMNGNMPANTSMSAASANGMNQAGQAGCGCNGVAAYGAGDYYNAAGCACTTGGGYPSECGIGNYFGDSGCHENQWFGGIYFLEMGRTNESGKRLTMEVPSGSTYPYYPQPTDTILTTRDANFDFREGLEVRLGSTFTIGEPSACPTGCNGYGYGYGNGCGCNSCAPSRMYAWEVAWWGLNADANTATVDFNGTDRIFGMKNFVGLQYDRNDNGNWRPVNDYFGYGLPVPAAPSPLTDGYIRVLSQYVRTDFQAQNLELNVYRFPLCDMGCGGCSSGSSGCSACGSGGAVGACGCDDSPSLGFSMYGSCGVRWFHVHDYLDYGTEYGEYSTGSGVYDQTAPDKFTFDNSNELVYQIDVKNDLVGPQLGWTNDYCYGKWDLFLNSTFGIFDNHITSRQTMWSGGDGPVRFASDGSAFNVSSHKDQVSFLGELRVGAAYQFACHWRAVGAYRAVAITGLATASDQMQNDFSNKESVQMVNSDSSTIIHGVQVGAECRY